MAATKIYWITWLKEHESDESGENRVIWHVGRWHKEVIKETHSPICFMHSERVQAIILPALYLDALEAESARLQLTLVSPQILMFSRDMLLMEIIINVPCKRWVAMLSAYNMR